MYIMDRYFTMTTEGEYTLPEVLTTTKTGKTNTWQIYVCNNYYYTITQTLPNGKLRRSSNTLCTSKNIGKINETSDHSQALTEAYNKWIKKSQTNIQCMLAQKYDPAFISEPFGVSPKLDGIRAIAVYDNGVQLISRTGKKFKWLDHIKRKLEPILKNTNIIIDGELYNHKMSFNELSGIVRSSKTKPTNDTHIEYWAFDLISKEPYRERVHTLQNFLPSEWPIQVLTYESSTHADIQNLHSRYLEQGYEGLIIRNLDAPYECGVRSRHLLKYKEFEDEEFVIVGFKCGVGSDQGAIIFQCKALNDQVFNVRPKGTLEERRQMYTDGKQYIGKQLTVRFQGKDEGNVPRFPVGVGIRDYE